MDSPEGKSLVETVNEIWTIWGYIFDIHFDISKYNKFNTWSERQMYNISRLIAESVDNQNKRTFNPIQKEFCELIYSLKRTYYDTRKEPTPEVLDEYDIRMISILMKLQTLYKQHSTHNNPDSIESPVTWLYIAVDNIWNLLYTRYQMSFEFTKSTDSITKADWNAIQNNNVSNFSIILKSAHFNHTLNETQKQFITLLVQMIKIDSLETEYATYMHMLADINGVLKTIPMSTPKLFKAQIHLALDRLISICEKLADQKMLGSEPL